VITIKLRYESSEEFQKLLKGMRMQQNIVVRSAFNRMQEGKSVKEIRQYIKGLKNTECLDSWWKESAFCEAKTIYSTKKESKIIFGGKNNLKKLIKKQITKEEFKSNRLLPLVSVGEALYKGNRKFKLDVTNSKLIFKDCNGKIKYDLVFKLQLRDRLEQLLHIEDSNNNKTLPLFVKVDEEFIYLTFKPKQKEISQKIENRVFAIDTNPESIGWSVTEFDTTNHTMTVIDSGVIELQELNKKSKNKRHHETYEVCKFLVDKAVHYKCEKFSVEDLSIKSKDYGNKVSNKKNNNIWIRIKLFGNLKKRCFINNIQFIEVNPAYTSVIGGTIHREYPDPIAPTFEIARRAVYKYQKGQFYPALPSVKTLNEQWKQTLENSFVSWKELSDWLKNMKYRYRVSLDSFESKVFRLKSTKSTVSCRFLYV
jgi:hypothetical protein